MRNSFVNVEIDLVFIAHSELSSKSQTDTFLDLYFLHSQTYLKRV